MRLADLNPYFIGSGGEGVFHRDPATGIDTPAPRREGVGLMCDCPCGNREESHQLFVPFHNPLDGGPPFPDDHHRWTRIGETFDALTLEPSIQRMDPNGCRWHGWIRNGEIVSA